MPVISIVADAASAEGCGLCEDSRIHRRTVESGDSERLESVRDGGGRDGGQQRMAPSERVGEGKKRRAARAEVCKRDAGRMQKNVNT